VEVLLDGPHAAAQHHRVTAGRPGAALLRQGAVGRHHCFQGPAGVEGGGQGDQPAGHVGADGALHHLPPQVGADLMAGPLAKGPGQPRIHRSGAQGQTAIANGLSGRLHQAAAVEAPDRALNQTHPHHLLLQPGGLPNKQGEGGGTAGALQHPLPEAIEVWGDLRRWDIQGGLQGQLGG